MHIVHRRSQKPSWWLLYYFFFFFSFSFLYESQIFRITEPAFSILFKCFHIDFLLSCRFEISIWRRSQCSTSVSQRQLLLFVFCSLHKIDMFRINLCALCFCFVCFLVFSLALSLVTLHLVGCCYCLRCCSRCMCAHIEMCVYLSNHFIAL